MNENIDADSENLNATETSYSQICYNMNEKTNKEKEAKTGMNPR